MVDAPYRIMPFRRKLEMTLETIPEVAPIAESPGIRTGFEPAGGGLMASGGLLAPGGFRDGCCVGCEAVPKEKG